jgi:hypothetical protein
MSLKMSEYAVQATLKEFALHVILLCKYMSEVCEISLMSEPPTLIQAIANQSLGVIRC